MCLLGKQRKGGTVPLYPPELTMSTGDGDKESISAANLPKGAYRTVLAKVSEAVLVETGGDGCEVSFPSRLVPSPPPSVPDSPQRRAILIDKCV